jgi:rhamnose transport system substrate-binding protein
MNMNIAKKLAIGIALAAALMAGTASAKDIKIGLVVKSLGNGFFEAANKGAQEAAKDLGGVQVIYTGPTSTTAEGQIEVINSLIAQGVDAIAISANDPDAVVPALKKATQRGIKVISFDSGVAAAGRILQLNPSSNELIGKMCLTLAKDHLEGGKGNFAILSATTTSTNQNIWIGEMKKQMKDFPGLNLVTTVYGDDLSDKSYREAQGILTSHPEVKVIVAPTTVGVLAASQAVKDAGKIGQVYVTGLGLPSEMAGAIKSGATKEFAIWNPIDLGYSTIQIAYRLVKGETDGKPGSEINAGRMGKIKVGANGEAAMADPFIYNASNIDQFSKVF